MSKNKKHNYNYNNNVSQNNQNDKETDTDIVEYSESSDNESAMVSENIEEVSESNEVVSDDINDVSDDCIVSMDSEEVTESTPEHVEVPVVIEEVETPAPKIEEKPKVSTPVNFYKVGTDFVNGRCINQIVATTELSFAKEECAKARSMYKKSYHVFDKDGNAVYTTEYTIPKDNYYRVGTDWKNGTCINQKYSITNIDLAINSANENTKLSGIIHHVYDPSGRVVFSAKKKLILLSYKKRGTKNVDWYTK